MVQNIAIVGTNRDVAHKIAWSLARKLDLHFIDTIELFNFDYKPRTLSSVLKEQGEDFFREKEKGSIKYVCDFSETVINLESGMCKNLENFKTIKQNCLLIYLHAPASKVKKQILSKKYENQYEEKFFNIELDELKQRINILKENADIVYKLENTQTQTNVNGIIEEIENYYKK